MIRVSYCGRLGNRLFQFAFGAVLSRLSGQPLCASPIPLFPGTRGFAGDGCGRGAHIPPHGFDLNLDEWVERARREDIIVSGYPHNTAYYEPQREWLAPILAPETGDVTASDDDDVVLHLRLGDFFSPRRHNLRRFGYPIDAIYKLLARLDYDRCLVVTDTTEHEAVDHLIHAYRGVLCAGSIEHDYRTLHHARRLILSPSTFGWWAAWTGHATEIYFPHEMGYWQARRGCRLAMTRPNVRRYDARGELL